MVGQMPTTEFSKPTFRENRRPDDTWTGSRLSASSGRLVAAGRIAGQSAGRIGRHKAIADPAADVPSGQFAESSGRAPGRRRQSRRGHAPGRAAGAGGGGLRIASAKTRWSSTRQADDLGVLDRAVRRFLGGSDDKSDDAAALVSAARLTTASASGRCAPRSGPCGCLCGASLNYTEIWTFPGAFNL